jgi:2-(1,2-epoxy-1,2-dihydrophenyl)acetyl-CoA isomerase
MDATPNDPQQPLLFSTSDGIARLRFNRPAQLNALDLATARAFEAACREIADDRSVRVVVLSGEGRGFGAGGDLQAFRGDDVATAALAIMEPMHAAVKILTALDAPVVASLHGVVAGGTMSLALACDLAIAAEGTKFNLAYVNIGSSCDVSASYHLPRLVGLRNALKIALLGETFDAAEALRLGLVNQVVPPDQLTAETEKVVQRLANGATRAIGRLKRLMRDSCANDLATQLDLERDAFRAGTRTGDFREGLDAFFARRTPRFTGH